MVRHLLQPMSHIWSIARPLPCHHLHYKIESDESHKGLGPHVDEINQYLSGLRRQLVAEGHNVLPQVIIAEGSAASNDPDVRGVIDQLQVQ